MIFTEFRFFYFLLAVFSLYWLLPTNRSRKIFLLAASYVFYSAWDWRFLSLILISTITDYVVGLRLHESTDDARRRNWLIVSLGVNLGILGLFKYFNFFSQNAAIVAESLGLSVDATFLEIILPVGISFYTFQTLSYTIDIYRRKLEPTRNGLDFALFVAFFPQLVAGPIVRARDFIYQLSDRQKFSAIDFRWALMLFLVGFVKKACIADNLAMFADPFFSAPHNFGLVESWLALSAYTAQIFCDFSGYSDMAIATAGMFGYRLRENFNSPYIAINIADFWRRWHMSLSSWLRDYLYISLGGNRKGIARTNSNLMITMLLGGLWHGAAWNFVIWGLMHGLALVVHRVYKDSISRYFRIPEFFAIALTLLFVMLSWVVFRAGNVEIALQIWSQLFSWSAGTGNSIIAMNQTLLVLMLPALWVAHYLYGEKFTVSFWRNCSPVTFAVGYGACFAFAIASRATEVTPFIYFQF